MLNDSVPQIKSVSGVKTDSSAAESAIKEVPKSRKQGVPVAVSATVAAKPVKIIRPKIIKPVIKVK
jgi:hypothetical protein